MAEKLSVTSSFLSAVENGKKKIPDGWLNALEMFYDLSEDERKDLEFGFCETNDSLKISFDGLANENKQLAFSFARKLNSFDSEKIERFRAFLEGADD